MPSIHVKAIKLLIANDIDQASEIEKKEVFFELLKEILEEFHSSTFDRVISGEEKKVALDREDQKQLHQILSLAYDTWEKHCEPIE